MAAEPRVTFAFATRGLARVKRDIQEVQNAVARGANTTAGRGGSAAARNASAERAASRLVLIELGRRSGAYRALAAEAQRAEGVITAAVVGGGQRRTRAGQEEARNRIRTWRDVGRMYAQVEREGSRAQEREANRRAQRRERERREAGQRGERAGTNVLGYATGVHNALQDVRVRRANAGAGITDIIRGAGGTDAEAAALRTRFAAQAERLGMRYEDLVGAAADVQTESSYFSRSEQQRGRGLSEAQAREENYRNFFAQAELGRDVVGQQGVGQFVRVAGLVRGAALDAGAQRQTLLGMSRLAELGAIELRNVTKEAMQPLMAQVGQSLGSLGPHATEAQRSAAIQHALIQGMAEMEVMRGVAGYNPRNAGQIVAAIAPALQNPVVQQKMRTNILSFGGISRAERRRIEGALFEDDPARRGHRRLRSNLAADPVAFAAAAGAALENNPTLMRNIFAGGGHGNPQALQANWRNFVGGMFTSDGTETGYQRIQRFTTEAMAPWSQQELDRRHDLAEGDPLTALNRQQEAHDNALTTNTGAIQELSNRLAQLGAEHPLLAPLATGLTRLAAPKLGGLISKGLFGGGGPAGGGGGLAALGAGTLALGAGALAATGAALGLQNAEVSRDSRTTTAERARAFFSTDIDAATRLGEESDRRRTRVGLGVSSRWDPAALGLDPAAATGGLQLRLSPADMQSLAAAIRANPLMVQLSPQAAAQAAGQQRTQATADRNRT